MKTRAISLLLLSLFMMLSSCDSACSSEIISTSESPNGFARASFIKANCGATTPFRYDVRVSDTDGEISSGTLVLRFDDNHAREWVDDDATLIDMSWQGNKELELRLTKPVRIFESRSSVEGIKIKFDFMGGSKVI